MLHEVELPSCVDGRNPTKKFQKSADEIFEVKTWLIGS